MAQQDTLEDSSSLESKGTHVSLIVSSQKGVWLYWILGTGLAATGGGTAFQALRQSRVSGAWIAGLAVLGLVVGLAQSFVLERAVSKSGGRARITFQWTLACSTAWMAGGVAGSVLPIVIWLILAFTANVDYTWIYHSGYYVIWVSFIASGSLAVSIIQQRVLQTRFNSVVKWRWPSIIGWFAGWTVGLVAAHIVPGSEIAKGVAGGAIGGAVLGTLTGRALVHLLAGSRTSTEP